MKKIIFISLAILLVNCKQNEQSKLDNIVIGTIAKSKVMDISDEINIDWSKIKKQEAIVLLNEIYGWMKKGITKGLSTSKVNDKINPLMKKYELKLSQLNKEDSLSVQTYRVEQVNEMINLQMQQ
jgi:hypothetical protein